MTNHIHLIVVPESEAALGLRGHLFQGRFSSYCMDERYLLAAVRYIELNPVRAN